MEINQIAYNGMPYTELPFGFGMEVAVNEHAVHGYAGLTEAEKEKVILSCKDAKTRDQMQKVVDSMIPGADVQEMFEEERDQFS